MGHRSILGSNQIEASTVVENDHTVLGGLTLSSPRCAAGVSYKRERADAPERQLEQHAPDEATVRLSLTDDVFLRSHNWAHLQLGIPLPVEEWSIIERSLPAPMARAQVRAFGVLGDWHDRWGDPNDYT